MKQIFLIVSLSLGIATACFAQTGEVKNDTIYFLNDVNKPIEFSKAIGKFLYIQNVVPPDLPAKSRNLFLISSNSKEIDPKLITVIDNLHILIPIHLFEDKYYTLYIKKGGATLITKKLIIR